MLKIRTMLQEIVKSGTVYALELDKSKYYVGFSHKNVNKRIAAHFEGVGSEWTKKYPPLKVLETIPGDTFDEDMLTKRYMAKYSIDNVRGGSYCQVTLPKESIQSLSRELNGVSGACFRCGEYGHYIQNCMDKEPLRCIKCGRNSHTSEKCFAKTHLNGTILPTINNKRLAPKIPVAGMHTTVPTIETGCNLEQFDSEMDIETSPPPLQEVPIDQSTLCVKCGRPAHAIMGFCMYTRDVYSNPIKMPLVEKAYSIINKVMNWSVLSRLW